MLFQLKHILKECIIYHILCNTNIIAYKKKSYLCSKATDKTTKTKSITSREEEEQKEKSYSIILQLKFSVI